MNSLPLPIPLHRSAWIVAFDSVLLPWRRLQSAWAVRRALETIERELAHLDPRTLQDIGAPQGLVGQRRWQAEGNATRAPAARPERLVRGRSTRG